jgi:DNA-directed RNA polymerase subunit RPC12/RpoP
MRLIDADMLELDTEWSEYMDGFTSYSQFQIDNAPTIEPEVRHGEWHECWHNDTVCASICTNCGKAASQARHIVGQELMTNVRYPLCPNCGARMDGEGEQE